MKHIPYLLIYSRVLFALIIFFVNLFPIATTSVITVTLIILAILTDIFDGIIARKMRLSSEKIRTHDSSVDLIFWINTIFSVFYHHFDLIQPIIFYCLAIVLLETLAYLISFIKFKRSIATHSILAKLWAISLAIFLIELSTNQTHISFYYCFILGLISRLEIILIILLLKKWTTDVPSILAVFKLNNGKPVKKSKLFNS